MFLKPQPCAFLCFTLLNSIVHAQFQAVTIYTEYPHSCVGKCVYNPDGTRLHSTWYGIERILRCADPAANRCYCTTASSSASAVDSFLSSCASASCWSGDLTDDLLAMKSIYASYCMEAGFTAPIISNWFTPATATIDSTTTGGSTPATTTQMTIVTQTTSSNSGLSSAQVTVQLTSTQWVKPQGSSVSVPTGENVTEKPAFRGGLAGGIIIFAAIVGIAIWIFCRRRRRQLQHPIIQSPPPTQQQWPQYPPPSQVFPIAAPSNSTTSVQRKPLKSPPMTATEAPSPVSPTTELAGGDGVRGEISGRELHPFPVINNSPPVAVPGNHELNAAPPAYQSDGSSVQVPRNQGQGQHWELP